MADKYQLLTEAYLTAIAELTADAENWQRFLTVAGKHYQVPFDEQVLIYTQRPLASKVMTVDEWNNKGYWIRRGSKGIAVFTHPLTKRTIRYYFDIADTYVGKDYQGEELSSLYLTEQEKGYIVGSIKRRSQRNMSFAQAIYYGAKEAVAQTLSYYHQRIAETLLNDLEEADSFQNHKGMQQPQQNEPHQKNLQNLLTHSVTYMLLSQLEPESLSNSSGGSHLSFDVPNVFADITKYQNIKAANTLGVCLSYASKSFLQELQQLQKQARAKFAQSEQLAYSEDNKATYHKQGAKENPSQSQDQDKNKNQIQIQNLSQNFEGSEQHDRLNIPRGKRHSDTKFSDAKNTGVGTLRPGTAEIPDRLPGDTLHPTPDNRRAEQPLAEHPATSGRNERLLDGRNGESRRDNRNPQNEQPNGMGRSHEQFEITGTRNHLKRTHLSRRSHVNGKLYHRQESLVPALAEVTIEPELTIVSTSSVSNSAVAMTPTAISAPISEKVISPVKAESMQIALEDLLTHQPEAAYWTVDAIKQLTLNTKTLLTAENQIIGYGQKGNGFAIWEGEQNHPDRESVFSWALAVEMLNDLAQQKQSEQRQTERREIDVQPALQINLFDDFTGFAQDALTEKEHAGDGQKNALLLSKPVIAEDVWNAALYYGAEYLDRFLLAQYFSHPRTQEEKAQYLMTNLGKNAFGRGIMINGTKYAIWYDEDGIRIGYGQTVRTQVSEQRDWQTLAANLQQWLTTGQYLTAQDQNVLLPELENKLIHQLIYMTWDMSEEAKTEGYLHILSHQLKGNFPACQQTMQNLLHAEQTRTIIHEEIAVFAQSNTDATNRRSLLRFRYHNVQDIARMCRELYLPMPDIPAAQRPVVELFITDDEIHAELLDKPHIVGAAQKIRNYLANNTDNQACARFIAGTYGWSSYSDNQTNFQANSKGWHYIRRYQGKDYDEVKYNWQQVVRHTRQAIALAEEDQTAKGKITAAKTSKAKADDSTDSPSATVVSEPTSPEIQQQSISQTANSPAEKENTIENKAAEPKKADDIEITEKGKEIETEPEKAVHENATTEPLEPEAKSDTINENPISKDTLKQQAYAIGDTIYLEDTAFNITDISTYDVTMLDPTLPYPVFRVENKQTFHRLLKQDERNQFITEYLASEKQSINQDLADVLLNTLLTPSEKKQVKEQLSLGNSEAALWLMDNLANQSETTTLETGETADYFSDNHGIRIEVHDTFSTRITASWQEIAEDLRTLFEEEALQHSLFPSPSAIQANEAATIFSSKAAATQREQNNPQRRIGEQAQSDVLQQSSGQEQSDEQVHEEQLSTLGDNPSSILDDTQVSYLADEQIDALSNEQTAVLNSNQTAPMVNAPSSTQERPPAGASDLILTAQLTDYRLPDENFSGTPSQKFQANLAAIRTLKQIEAEQRLATDEEKAILAQYTGWGGLAEYFEPTKNGYQELKDLLTEDEYAAARSSTLTAFYTDNRYTDAIWQAVQQLGFQGGNILEPACGTGRFLGRIPSDIQKHSRVYGVELDSLSGRIAKALYPTMDITIQGYEKTAFQDNVFDLAISNVPFAQIQVQDDRYDKLHLPIHDYYFAKTLDKVRPGGIIAFITSSYTLDKTTSKFRRYLAERADLLEAVRLPEEAFQTAGTSVTSDIIFLQKRERPLALSEELPWLYVANDEKGLSYNQYFIQHPEQIVGEMVEVSTAYGVRVGCKLRKNTSLQTETEAEAGIGIKEDEEKDKDKDKVESKNETERYLQTLLDNAIGNIQRQEPHPLPREQENLPDVYGLEEDIATGALPAQIDVDNYSYTIYGGKIYYRENALMKPVDGSEAKLERMRALIGLRHTVKKLIHLQLENYPDEAIQEQQILLNDQYDVFLAQYGTINSKANKQVFRQDSSYYLLCSLENIDENGKLLSKADFFHKRTIWRAQLVNMAENAMDTLAICIAQKAAIDLDYMETLLANYEQSKHLNQDKHSSQNNQNEALSQRKPITKEDIINELTGVIYRNPLHADPEDLSTGWEMDEEYLCGNVRQKLREAKQAALVDASYAINVKALEAVQPKDLGPGEIYTRLGASWIPAQYIEAFMYETLETPYYHRSQIRVNYSELNDSWHISSKSLDFGVMADDVYGTKRINAYHILERTLNLKDIKIFDTTEQDGKEVKILNAKETMIAQSKQALLKEKFTDWLWQDYDRRNTLVALYNERFNALRLREYDGSHILFDGKNPEITLRPHQVNAIARILYGGNTLLAHCVGAGKTYEIVAAAMESKRLGLCSKSLIVVPNHLTEQWGSEWLQLYPAAHILVATKKDFETANRKTFCARIATGDYDAVIIGHSQFERIPLSMERRTRYIQAQLDDMLKAIAEAKSQVGQRFTVKQLEKSKKNLEEQLEKLHDTKRKDDVITFEELGIDRLFVDEAHNFKNLFLRTKMSNVAGISQTEAQKSSDLYMKCQYLDEITHGKGIIFATGTPVSNSMCELYTMQRYLQYDLLEENHLQHFDAWASTFGETVTTQELKPEGTGYRERIRFAKFHNLPELMTLFRQIADIQTAEMLKLPTPAVERHIVTLEPSILQKEMVAALAERAEKVRNRQVDSNIDNMLVITNDGRKLALDQRLLNDMLPDDENSKTNRCADNIYTIWQDSQNIKGTQLVFSDLSTPTSKAFNVYDDLKEKLMLRGIPENEIAYIHNAKTEQAKKALFAQVRAGQVRILIGSTQKMGAGTNVQKRLIALHHLDCPWRPADMEQREGRIIRQGNENETVHIYTYVTKDTFDAYLYQIIENKQRFISQIMQGGDTIREAEDVDEAVLSYAEIKALATGNPLIREKMELDTQVSRLKVLKANHTNQCYQLEVKIRQTYPEQIANLTKAIQGYLEDIALLQKPTVAVVDAPTIIDTPTIVIATPANTGATTATDAMIPATILTTTPTNAAAPEPATLTVGAIDTSFTEEGFTELTIAGQRYTERKKAGEALLAQLEQIDFHQPTKVIGSYKGFDLSVRYNTLLNNFYAELTASMTYTVELGKDASGNITRLDNKLKALPEELQKTKEKLEEAKTNLARAKEELAKPFAQEEELKELQTRLEEINEALDIGKPTPDFSSTDEEELSKAEPLPSINKKSFALAMERA